MSARRADLWRLAAAILCGAALWGLLGETGDREEPAPPPLEPGLARARPDGGQMLNLAHGVPPNELSRLSLGQRVDFKTARPDLLSRLPGLGLPTIKRGRERGGLLDHQSQRAKGLIMNYETEEEE